MRLNNRVQLIAARATAFLLILTMFAGLMPVQPITAVAQDGEGVPLYTYDLMKAWTSGSSTGTDIRTVTDFAQTTSGDPAEINPANGIVTDPWVYAGESSSGFFNWKDATYGGRLENTRGEWGAFKINVPEAGDYLLTSWNGYWPSGTTVNVYFAPEDAANPRDEQYRLGTIDSYSSTTQWVKDVPFKNVSLSAGNYIVSYKQTGRHPKSVPVTSASQVFGFVVRGFKLQAAREILEYIDPVHNLCDGDTAERDLIVASAAGKPQDLSQAVISATSGDLNVADVIVIREGESAKLSVLGKKTGDTTVNVSVTLGDNAYNVSIPVIVKAQGQYAMTKLQTRINTSGNLSINTVDVFTKTTMGHPDEINKAAGIYTDPWIFAGRSRDDAFDFRDRAYGCMLDGDVGDYGAIKIDVAKTGTYALTSWNGYWKYGPKVDVFFAPEDAPDPRHADYKIGEIDSYGPTTSWINDVFLKTQYVQAGKYIISYVHTGSNASASRDSTHGYRFPFYGFKLYSACTEFSLQQPSAVFINKDEEKLVALAATINGQPANLNDADELTAVCSDDSVATVEIVSTAMPELKVTGVSGGTTQITVTAVMHGVTAQVTVPVTVTASAEDISYTYDLMKALIKRPSTGTDIKTILSFLQTTIGSDDEINKDNGVDTDPWIFAGESKENTFNWRDGTYGGGLDGLVGDWGAFKINVAEAGDYLLTSWNGFWASAPVVNVYFAPENAEAPRDEQYLLGTIDGYSSSARWVEEVPFKNMHVEAGNYIVSYEQVGSNSKSKSQVYGYRFPIRGFKLQPARDTFVHIDPIIRLSEGASATRKIIIAAASGVHKNLTDSVITAVPVNTNIADAVVVRQGADAHLLILGKSVGDTVINVTVTLGAEVYTSSFSVNVKPPLEYNLMKMLIKKPSTGTDITTVTSFTQTTMGHPDEINKELGVETDPWKFAGRSSDGAFLWTDGTYGCMVSGGIGSWGAYTVQVPEAGSYQLTSWNGYWESGPIVNVYFAPESAENPRSKQYLLGSIDSYSATRRWVEELPFENMYVEKGNYTISYEIIGMNENSKRTVLGYRFPVHGFKLLSAQTMFNYISPAVIYTGEGVSNELVISDSDGSHVDLTNADITAISADNEIAEIKVTRQGSRAFADIRGLKQGNTSVTVSLTLGSKVYTRVIPVSVKVVSFDYNFMKLHISGSGLGVDIKTINSFTQTTMGHPDEINVARGVYTDPWIWEGQGDGGNLYFTDSTYACMLDGIVGAWGAVRIRVPTDGVFMACARNGFWERAPIVEVYLAPADAKNPRDTRYLLGTIDGYDTTRRWWEKTPLRNVSLTAGDYIVTYKQIGKNPSSSDMRFPVGGFLLEPRGEQELYLSRSHGAFPIGLPRELSIFADVDGTPIPLSELDDLSVTLKNPEIATVEISESQGIIITAQKQGSTTVTAEAEYRGLTRKIEFTINTVSADTVSEVELWLKGEPPAMGEKAQLGLRILRHNGEEIPREQAAVYFDSLSPEVAVVNAQGEVNVIGMGKTKLRVFVEQNGVLCDSSVDIEVNESLPVVSATLHRAQSLMTGRTSQLRVSAEIQGGMVVTPPAATVEYELMSATPSDAVALDGNGRISARVEGSAQIRAKVTLGGVQVLTEPITITVFPQIADDIEIDFKTYVGKGRPLTITLDAEDWEIDRINSTPELPTLPSSQFEFRTNGLWINPSVQSEPQPRDVTVSVNVPVSGNYMLQLSGGKTQTGGVSEIYMNDGYAGVFDFYSNVQESDTATLGVWSLSSGVNRVTFRVMPGAGSGASLILENLGLILQDDAVELETLEAKLKPSELFVGESATVEYTARLSGDVPIYFGTDKNGDTEPNRCLVVENLTPELLELLPGLRVSAKQAGNASLSVKAIAWGTEKTVIIEIPISGEALAELDLNLEQPQLFVGQSVPVTVRALTQSGHELRLSDIQLSYNSANSEIFTVVNGIVTAHAQGTAELTVIATLGNATVSATLPVIVSAVGFAEVELHAETFVMKPDFEGVQLSVRALDNNGNEMPLAKDATIVYESLNPDIFTVTAEGWLSPNKEGSGKVRAVVTMDGVTRETQRDFTARPGKTGRTFYTDEKLSYAQYNIENFAWAKKLRDDAIKKAEPFVGLEDLLWRTVTTQELPRSITVGYRYDPLNYTCRYCGANLLAKYGSSPWWKNELVYPWKLQCPECKRRFPSNDFDKFYKLGIDETATWRYEDAKRKNAELVASGHDGYLKNILYPEMGEGWGVDDGYGYKTGKMSGPVEEVHTYVSYYNRALYNNGLFSQAWIYCRDAYLYTGDIRYGRVGAILIDRFADVYPDMYIEPYFPNFYNSDANNPKGRLQGRLFESSGMQVFTQYYDAFYPAFDDPQVTRYLSERAKEYDLGSDKSTPEINRQNVEDGLLREIHKGILDGNIRGGTGTQLTTMALAATVLDTQPETDEWIDWIFRPSVLVNDEWIGGGIFENIIGTVSHDGISNQSSPEYNGHRLNILRSAANILRDFGVEKKYDLYENPFFIKLGAANLPLTLARRATAQIGDSGRAASLGFEMDLDAIIEAFGKTKDVMLAQAIYFLSNGKMDSLHYDIFSDNSTSIADEVNKIIEEHGEYPLDDSMMLTGYGFSILRGGTLYHSVGHGNIDTQRDFWLYWGGGVAHKHADTLNLGIEAYGLNMAPDIGYPMTGDASDNNRNWGHNTIGHNTVVVNETRQKVLETGATPLHFDDSGAVKVMDVDASMVYDTADIYRRTVVMVDVNDEVSYGVDFFRVKGGEDHLYSFHSQSDTIAQVSDNLRFISQPMGSYAGPNVPWGTPGHTTGYSWFKNVRRASMPSGNEFFVDFKVTDFRSVLPRDLDLHMRLTMINDFSLNEVALSDGVPAQIGGAPKKITYMFARRQGDKLDSLFTGVYEPYSKERYLEKIEQVEIERIGGVNEGMNDTAKAVKVTHTGGKEVDYIVYATNNRVRYRIDDLFDFSGFVGVVKYHDDGTISRAYANDATHIAGYDNELAAYTGTVRDFTRELSFENSIMVSFNSGYDIDNLAGRYIYIDNDKQTSGAYKIESAEKNSDGTVTLHVGNTPFIRELLDSADINGGYVYNIVPGQRFRIPIPMLYDTSPVFTQIEEQVVDANSSIRVSISAVSPIEKELAYYPVLLPRGASFDAGKRVFSWTPDASQVGQHQIAIRATDGKLSSTIYFPIKVLGATTGGKGSVAPPTNGGGGQIPGHRPGNGTDHGVSNRFTDLAEYSWAEDAINTLAERGIVRGVTANTFAPSHPINRADFAILMVRAFKLEGESAEQFSDVPEDAYYAGELSIAIENGIIAGMGNNCYNPTGFIKRQDMFLILYRTLLKSGYSFDEVNRNALDAFHDGAQVSDYAEAAVTALVEKGIIKGADGKLLPDSFASRAEVAVLLNRILMQEQQG